MNQDRVFVPQTPPAPQSPEQRVETLCSAHPRSADSIRLVHRVCLQHGASGSKDFSLATIGKLCSAAKGPSGSYLRTRPASKYRAVIESVSRSMAPRQRQRVRPRSDIDAVLEGLPDATVRARVGVLLAELQSLRREKRGFGFKVQAPTTPVTPAGPLSDGATPLTGLERLALTQAIDARRLQALGWVTDARGRVLVERTGAVVFPAGFVTGLGKVLQSSPLPSPTRGAGR